ncbi:uncharacterized protein LOC130705550 [Balaenoptera acutorostrata]|uniref:sphingomyelin phosphodiesterase n=1 Tax=Balaenoptera acutorostrata TaxID=9767 RepID=A0ABM3SEX0_BALAC|nr:uncharacterized protein LOC130705550 [Balaenoptera acutorostrata]
MFQRPQSWPGSGSTGAPESWRGKSRKQEGAELAEKGRGCEGQPWPKLQDNLRDNLKSSRNWFTARIRKVEGRAAPEQARGSSVLGCNRAGARGIRGWGAGFHLARVPRWPGLLRRAEPTALPPDWKLLGEGSQSRLHCGLCRALSRWLVRPLRVRPFLGLGEAGRGWVDPAVWAAGAPGPFHSDLREEGEADAARSAQRAPLPVVAPARNKKCRPPLGVGCTQKLLPSAPGHARTSRLARWKPVSRRRDLLPRAPRATPSPPDWPPTPCALRPSPFPHPVLHALPGLARALLFPAYWALDQLLGCWAPAARPSDQIWLSAAAGAGAALLLLLLVGPPLALPDLLLWLLLQAWRRPFCYQPPPQCGAPPTPWRPPTEPARSFSFFSANLCLLPYGLARFSNLPHSQRRAETVGAVLLAGLRHSPYGATGCSSPVQGMPCGVLIGAMPASLDFTCLQELFDLRAERRLVSRLAPNLGPVSYDVGTFGLQPGLHLKLLGSGLLLASRYPLLRAALQSFLTHVARMRWPPRDYFLHRNAAEHLQSPPLRGLLRGDAEGCGHLGARQRPEGGLP